MASFGTAPISLGVVKDNAGGVYQNYAAGFFKNGKVDYAKIESEFGKSVAEYISKNYTNITPAQLGAVFKEQDTSGQCLKKCGISFGNAESIASNGKLNTENKKNIFAKSGIQGPNNAMSSPIKHQAPAGSAGNLDMWA